jgi:hypothetical protein
LKFEEKTKTNQLTRLRLTFGFHFLVLLRSKKQKNGEMNYLTAVVAAPLFLAICAFEWYISLTREVSRKGNARAIVTACLVVSTLQATSCLFWLFGFIFSETDDILSEAMGPGEVMNCFGLVGAEVILAVFQLIFTMLTCYIMLVVRNVQRRVNAMAAADVSALVDRRDLLLWCACGVGMSVYTGLAWVTAHNRRCPQAEPVLPALQHHFYPVYLLVDCTFALGTVYYIHLVRNQLLEGRTRDGLLATMEFYRWQAHVTIAGALFAVLIFVIQYTAQTRAFSMLACVFCVCMYVTYAMRRVPMVMMHVCMSIPFISRKYHEATKSRAAAAASRKDQTMTTLSQTPSARPAVTVRVASRAVA